MSLAALFLVLVSSQFAMSDSQVGQLWNCHIPEKQLMLVAEPKLHQMQGRVVLMYRLSRQGSKRQDTILIYETRNNKPQPFPHYYFYDMDFDGKPDKGYVDEFGNGLCQQMHEIDVAVIIRGGKPL